MCTPGMYEQMSGSAKTAVKALPKNSLGMRLDKAQRAAKSTVGGGTYQGRTIMDGVPRNTDVAAVRNTTMLGV